MNIPLDPRRRDFAVICGDRDPVSGLDAMIAACDALNRAGIVGDDGLLLGDGLIEQASAAGALPVETILHVRRVLIDRHPGTVSREPSLVAFWDMGPECAIRACHLGDGDDDVIGHVSWARSYFGDNDGACGALGGKLTTIGRARLLYLRESHPGCHGKPWIRADLESHLATRSVAAKYLR